MMRLRIIVTLLILAALANLSPVSASHICGYGHGPLTWEPHPNALVENGWAHIQPSRGVGWGRIFWVDAYPNQLALQYGICMADSCDCCMAQQFGSPGNFFICESSPECNGVPWLYWELPISKWLVQYVPEEKRSLLLYGTVERFENARDVCYQSYGVDWWCEYDHGSLHYDVWGAYVPGDEWDLEELEIRIKRSELGPPESYETRPFPDIYWENFGHWLAEVSNDHPPTALHRAPWLCATHAAQRYLVTVKKGIIASQEELEFAETVYIHALVCSQAWHGYEFYWPILTDAGIEPWICGVEETPTFVYWMNDFIDRYFQVPVNTETGTWGTVKAVFR